MKIKRLLSISLATLMVLGIFGALPMVYAASEGRLYIDPGDVTVLKGSETSVFPLWPQIDLEFKVSGVTDIVGIWFSLEWNTSNFVFDSILMGTKDPTDFIYHAAKPSGQYSGPDITPPSPPPLHEFYYTQMAGAYGYAPKSWTVANPGLVTKLRFNYTGPSPSPNPATWVDTWINITDRDLTELMRTGWAKWITGTTLNEMDFSPMDGFHLLYKGVAGTPEKPVGRKVVLTPTPIYVGTTVQFDADYDVTVEGSKKGFDGDDWCPITEWHWDFGEGAGWEAPENDPDAEHTYTTAGTFTVKLKVVAPKIGWAHDDYENTSDVYQETISIKVLAKSGIDVYTEDYRWPFYEAVKNGTGEGEPADCFRPQENVDLYAYVIYNESPVQNKLVKFYIKGPENTVGNFSFTRTAYTSNGTVWNGTAWINMDEGVAWIPFRIPWPCKDAQIRVFGTWTVCVQVALPDVKPGEETIYEDCLQFKVSWGVSIVALRTLNSTGDPVEAVKKCETITVEVDMTNCYLGPRWVCLAISVYDDVGTIVASCHISLMVQGETTWCNPVITTANCTLHIPKWAYVGANARAYANIYTEWPWIPAHAEPWGPEASAVIEIVKM